MEAKSFEFSGFYQECLRDLPAEQYGRIVKAYADRESLGAKPDFSDPLVKMFFMMADRIEGRTADVKRPVAEAAKAVEKKVEESVEAAKKFIQNNDARVSQMEKDMRAEEAKMADVPECNGVRYETMTAEKQMRWKALRIRMEEVNDIRRKTGRSCIFTGGNLEQFIESCASDWSLKYFNLLSNGQIGVIIKNLKAWAAVKDEHLYNQRFPATMAEVVKKAPELLSEGWTVERLMNEDGRYEAEKAERKADPHAGMRQCPKCGEWVPNMADLCRCGYEFSTGTTFEERNKGVDEKTVEDAMEKVRNSFAYDPNPKPVEMEEECPF